MRLSLALPLALLLTLGACNTLTPLELQQYDNLLAQGAQPLDEKDPAIAAVLNVMPGFGDIYNGEWGAFALDLLLWYPSILWAVPQGAVTANNYNKRATLAYYSIGAGKAMGFDMNATRLGEPRIPDAP